MQVTWPQRQGADTGLQTSAWLEKTEVEEHKHRHCQQEIDGGWCNKDIGWGDYGSGDDNDDEYNCCLFTIGMTTTMMIAALYLH